MIYAEIENLNKESQDPNNFFTQITLTGDEKEIKKFLSMKIDKRKLSGAGYVKVRSKFFGKQHPYITVRRRRGYGCDMIEYNTLFTRDWLSSAGFTPVSETFFYKK